MKEKSIKLRLVAISAIVLFIATMLSPFIGAVEIESEIDNRNEKKFQTINSSNDILENIVTKFNTNIDINEIINKKSSIISNNIDWKLEATFEPPYYSKLCDCDNAKVCNINLNTGKGEVTANTFNTYGLIGAVISPLMMWTGSDTAAKFQYKEPSVCYVDMLYGYTGAGLVIWEIDPNGHDEVIEDLVWGRSGSCDESWGLGVLADPIEFTMKNQHRYLFGAYIISGTDSPEPMSYTKNEFEIVKLAVYVEDSGEPDRPEVEITRPKNNHFYFRDKEYPFTIPFVVYDITVKAEAYSKSGINKVDFFFNGVRKHTDTTYPYSWECKESFIGAVELKVKATDNEGVYQYSGPVKVFYINP